eukprot:9402592-Alexandrium_andersonii.AAC.1
MSASLVGSEMCIRDSPVAPREATAPRTPPTGATHARRRRQFSLARERHGCLLYTSDAADDM